MVMEAAVFRYGLRDFAHRLVPVPRRD